MYVTNAKKPAAKKPGPAPTAKVKLDAIGVDQVVALIADGDTYRKIAKMAGVGLGTLCTWIEADPERSRACARAREISAQAFEERAEEVISEAADMFELSKAKELASHWRWRAKAVNPKRYGEKVELEHKGNLGDLTDSQIEARIKALTAKVASDGPSEPVGS